MFEVHTIQRQPSARVREGGEATQLAPSVTWVAISQAIRASRRGMVAQLSAYQRSSSALPRNGGGVIDTVIPEVVVSAGRAGGGLAPFREEGIDDAGQSQHVPPPEISDTFSAMIGVSNRLRRRWGV